MYISSAVSGCSSVTEGAGGDAFWGIKIVPGRLCALIIVLWTISSTL